MSVFYLYWLEYPLVIIVLVAYLIYLDGVYLLATLVFPINIHKVPNYVKKICLGV